MRIGVMLRHHDQHAGGVRVYTHELLRHLLALDSRNEYVMMYRNPKLLGTYASHASVDEVAHEFPSSVGWDQVVVPRVERDKKLDIIFNPKFAVPLVGSCRRVFVMHGSEWYRIPEAFKWYHRAYNSAVIRAYCRRSDAIIAVSETVKRDLVAWTGVDPDKVFPISNGFDSTRFRVIKDEDRLATIARKYNLPDEFVLWVGQIYPPKNVGRLLRAFARIKDEVPHQLVLCGEQRWDAEVDLRLIKELDLESRVQLVPWVAHEDLAAIYNLATLFVLPSLYEGFGIPLLEAMASGCPIVTSVRGTPPEIVHDAALLADPLDVSSLADTMRRVLLDDDLQHRLAERGLQRATHFGWDRCAQQLLNVLEATAGS
jgi:glycosyltransferase involved in cell wall biosynthesis